MRRLAALALLLPPLIVFVVFFICPLVYLFYVSLHEASQSELFGASISLASYAAIFSDPFYATIILRRLSAPGRSRPSFRSHCRCRARASLRARSSSFC